MTTAEGTRVPDLTLVDQDGTPVSLRELAGSTVVLYFYPKDSTPGCTTQACDLRDNWELFEDRDDVLLFGVSPDGEASHRKFRDRHDLPFPLLVDEDHRLADAFGFWVEKKMYGKTFHGVERSTVVIAPDGTVQAVLRKVKPSEHVQLLRDELGL